MEKKTKIICTMGPAVNSKEMIRSLIENGMDIARLNFSHGDHNEHLERIEMIKEIREELNIPVAILLDTKGPEIRTGNIKAEKVLLKENEKFILTTEQGFGDNTKVSVTYQDITKDVKKGNRILIDDGLIELVVDDVNDTEVICTVINGGELKSKKGINIPNVSINLPPITEKDKEDIIFGINNGVDFIAASFVRNAEAIREIRKILKDSNSDINIIAKIENQEGIQNIDEIIEEADGIMVARGDLGVEVEPQIVPFIQKTIINKCNNSYKPVIIATQMLDSMIRNPRPTRAEVTDVANAVYDGTDAIMLSGETAAGKFPIEAIKMMKKIALETEAHINYDAVMKDKKGHRTRGISSAICYSAVATAGNVGASLIVASSFSGYTARIVSKFKPKANIIGLSPLDRTLRKMQICWGVKPVKTMEVNSTDQLLEEALNIIKENHYANSGDIVILTAGVPTGKTGVTNMIKVVEVN